MGSLSSVIAPIASMGASTLVSAGKYLVGNSDKIYDLKSLNAKNKQAAENATLQKQQNLLAFQVKETDRLNKLRRAISTQRATFGGAGVGSATGSAEAVYQGLNESSDIERQNNQAKTAMDNRVIDQSLAFQQQQNLLQKQELKQKTALGFLSDLVG